jgi:hypothetical protein
VVENGRLSDGRVAQRQVLYLGEINASQREADTSTSDLSGPSWGHGPGQGEHAILAPPRGNSIVPADRDRADPMRPAVDRGWLPASGVFELEVPTRCGLTKHGKSNIRIGILEYQRYTTLAVFPEAGIILDCRPAPEGRLRGRVGATSQWPLRADVQ